MYLWFIVPTSKYSIQTGILFNISVRDKLIPGTQFSMNHPDSCIQEYNHFN